VSTNFIISVTYICFILLFILVYCMWKWIHSIVESNKFKVRYLHYRCVSCV